jgi:hypothetical protein
MKKVYTTFVVAMLGLTAQAQEIKAVPAQNPGLEKSPMIVNNDAAKKDVLKEKQLEHNFGKIPQGKPVFTTFEFVNVGTDSLKLDNVQAGCGCTTPEWQAGPYAPNSKIIIKVGYNAYAEGAFTKPVTITYAGQSKVIYIKGEVWKTPETAAPANTGLSKLKD